MLQSKKKKWLRIFYAPLRIRKEIIRLTSAVKDLDDRLKNRDGYAR